MNDFNLNGVSAKIAETLQRKNKIDLLYYNKLVIHEKFQSAQKLFTISIENSMVPVRREMPAYFLGYWSDDPIFL
jgi:hypothetical protein